MGVPGEIAGLYEAWLQYGRLPWNTLFQPAIKLAKDGFVVAPYLANSIAETTKIFNDPGLVKVFAPNGKLLKAGDVCYNKDVRAAGGIMKMEDLKNYKVRVTDAVAVEAMGYTIYGMPSPSSGTLGMSMVMNIFKRWSQLRDHGTSHFCIVDAERNAVSMTTTVNYGFGAGYLSPSTGIVINNEMGDFSAPTEISSDHLPPSPANFIEPNKRPLSSMTPIIVTKGHQLAGVLGGSGGLYIIPAIVQVFLNHFVLGMEPLQAVLSPRVYHDLIPNVVKYENWTVICGNHIELAEERKAFLKERGHQLSANPGGAIVQLVVQSLQNPVDAGRKTKGGSNTVVHGMLTAVSDLRKDGRPAAV
ncbi:Glutathione hydrolase 3 [Linum perenne]